MFDSNEDFEQLTRNLNIDRQPPPGHRQELKRQMLAAFAQAQADQGPACPAGNRRAGLKGLSLMRNWKIRAAAAIVLAAMAAGVYLFVDRGTTVAFADVKEQIDGATTMTMTATAKMKSLPRPVITKMFFKYPGQMRQEITMEVPPGKQPATQPAAKPQTQTTICIFDMQKMQALILDPNQKIAMVVEYKNLPKNAMEDAKRQDFLAQLKKAVAGKHEDLGEKTIAGKKVKGYRSLDGRMIGMDIWVDASTGVPVQIDQTLPNDMGTVTMTDFVINPKLDDSLFSLAAPEGYKVEKQSFDFHVTEEGLIEGMRLLATRCGGVFPKTLTPTPELIKQLEQYRKARPKPTAAQAEAERKEFGEAFTSLMAFQVSIANAGGEFIYVGEGVKLGDKDTPVLWYKAKDAKQYTIVYGDLHTEQSDKAPKPAASTPAPSAGSGQAPNGASTPPQ